MHLELEADKFSSGSQGHGQGLNLRDNGLNVIIGVRKNGQSWKDAEQYERPLKWYI